MRLQPTEGALRTIGFETKKMSQLRKWLMRSDEERRSSSEGRIQGDVLDYNQGHNRIAWNCKRHMQRFAQYDARKTDHGTIIFRSNQRAGGMEACQCRFVFLREVNATRFEAFGRPIEEEIQ